MNASRLLLALLIIACTSMIVYFVFDKGAAQQSTSPFGISSPTAPAPIGGEFMRDKLGWIYQKQAEFYKRLTGTVKDAKTDGSAVWLLIGLSFLYGIFHAAGPGHGKVVISTYVLANEQSARRGMIISFIAAFMQALVAVIFISLAVFAFNLTSFAITDTTHWLERGSYALIALLGVYLLWQKGLQPLLAIQPTDARNSHHHAHDHRGGGDHDHDHSDHAESRCGHEQHGHKHDHGHACSCGGHAANPKDMQNPLSLRSAWAAIMSVGLRPCSGALIVLVFAAAQELYWVGVASAFSMALGTAITVTSLATIAVGAKGLATRYLAMAGAGTSAAVFKSVELLGASLVFLLGITLLAASLQG